MQTDASQTVTTEIDPAEYRKPEAATDQTDDTSTPTIDALDVNPVKVGKGGTPHTVSVKINVVRDANRQEIRRFNHAHETSE